MFSSKIAGWSLVRLLGLPLFVILSEMLNNNKHIMFIYLFYIRDVITKLTNTEFCCNILCKWGPKHKTIKYILINGNTDYLSNTLKRIRKNVFIQNNRWVTSTATRFATFLSSYLKCWITTSTECLSNYFTFALLLQS